MEEGSSATDSVTDVTDVTDGRRKKGEGRRKKEDVTIAMVSLIKNFLIVLAVAIG
ncbi:hypothetical protein [Microcoleus sp. herbarium13]|uniref:hypothetical protein n=1 Tax=Microcoleus sp. herbarium13 TaxID=3055438 RepID=UPI002FCF9054